MIKINVFQRLHEPVTGLLVAERLVEQMRVVFSLESRGEPGAFAALFGGAFLGKSDECPADTGTTALAVGDERRNLAVPGDVLDPFAEAKAHDSADDAQVVLIDEELVTYASPGHFEPVLHLLRRHQAAVQDCEQISCRIDVPVFHQSDLHVDSSLVRGSVWTGRRRLFL